MRSETARSSATTTTTSLQTTAQYTQCTRASRQASSTATYSSPYSTSTAKPLPKMPARKDWQDPFLLFFASHPTEQQGKPPHEKSTAQTGKVQISVTLSS